MMMTLVVSYPSFNFPHIHSSPCTPPSRPILLGQNFRICKCLNTFSSRHSEESWSGEVDRGGGLGVQELIHHQPDYLLD